MPHEQLHSISQQRIRKRPNASDGRIPVRKDAAEAWELRGMGEAAAMKITVDITPIGAVRMTAGMVKRIKWRLYQPGDKKVERVIKYLDYKRKLSWEAKSELAKVGRGQDVLTGPIKINLTFYIPMPESWSLAKKKRMDMTPHTTKPDRDNLEKGVCDSLNKIIWKDDGQVFDGRTVKYYSFNPRIEIEIEEASA